VVSPRAFPGWAAALERESKIKVNGRTRKASKARLSCCLLSGPPRPISKKPRA
jgi:hypothetical protein